MRRKIAALAAVAAAVCGCLATACGASGQEEDARSYYNAYRAAEDSRTDAEEELRLAFSDISKAAQSEDREAVLEAAQRGQDAVEKIDGLLTAELEAAHGLTGIDLVSADAKRLADGLQLSEKSLALVGKELEIALADPFLATHQKEVENLAKESTDLAVKGELAIRRADRALAVALGLEPRPDQMFTPTTG